MKATSSLVIAMCLALVLPSAARAQTGARSFPDLGTALNPGETVIVTQVNGPTLRGPLRELTASEIGVDESGRLRSIVRGDVQSIAVIEHRATLLGLAIGGGVGLGIATFLVHALRDCGGCEEDGAVTLRFVATSAGIISGALIQNAHDHERVIYRAPSKAVSVSPILLPSVKGVLVRIQF